MITLTEPSASLLPAFNRINYSILSDNADQTGFKYVVKVYNGNDELMTTAYYDAPADPATPVEFDVSKFVQQDFTYDVGVYQTAATQHSTGLIKKFYLKCYEYRDVDGTYVIVLNTQVTSANKYALAASFPLLELKTWYANVNFYTGVSNTGYKPLTSWTDVKLRSTDSQMIPFYNDGKVTNLELVVTLMNGTSSTYYLTPSVVTTPQVTFFKVTPANYGNVNYISLFLNYNNGTARRVPTGMTLYTQACGKFDPVRVAYLNKFGAWDYFNFDLVSRTSFDIERKGYQRNYTADIYEGNGVMVKNTNPIYYTKEMQKYKLVSDYLTDAQSQLLRQLYSSPLVYMNLVNDNDISVSWIPVKIMPNSYEVKQTATDKVFNIELDVEFGLVNTRQSI